MLQRSAIITSFEKSLKVVPRQFKSIEFEELRGFISIAALHMVSIKLKDSNIIGVHHASVCGCYFRRTYGLPCAHEIANFKREKRPIPLESIHIHWRKLDLNPVFNKVKFISKSEVHEIADPQATSLLETIAKQETWDQPNSEAHVSLHGNNLASGLVLSRQENCSLDSTVAPIVFMRPITEVKKEDWRSAEKVLLYMLHLYMIFKL